MANDVMGIKEFCETLDIGRNTAYDVLTSGKIKCFRIGKQWKIPKESVNEFIREQSEKNSVIDTSTTKASKARIAAGGVVKKPGRKAANPKPEK